MDNVERHADDDVSSPSLEAVRAELARATALSSLLVRLAELVHLKSEPNAVLLQVLNLVIEFGQFDCAEVFLYDAVTQTMCGAWGVYDNGLSIQISDVVLPLSEITDAVPENGRLETTPYILTHAEKSTPTSLVVKGGTLPLMIAGGILGCLKVDNRVTGRALLEKQIAELVPIAQQAALVVSHSIVSAERDSTVRHQTRFLDILPEVRNNEGPDNIFRSVRDAIMETCALDRASVFAVRNGIAYGTWGTDEDGNIRDEHGFQFPVPHGGEHLAPFERDGQRYVIDTIRAKRPSGEVENEVPHAYMPIQVGNDIAGIIAVDNLLTMRRVTPEMLIPVLAIGDQAAIAMEKSKLLTEQKAIVREQRRLMEIAVAITAKVDPDAIFRMVRDAILETGMVDRVGVFVVAGMRAYGTWGTDQKGQPRDEHDLSFDLDTLATEYPSCLLGDDPYVIDTNRTITLTTGGSVSGISFGLIPLRAGKEMIGLISADMLLSRRRFTPDMIELILPLVRQAAVVIQNSRLMVAAEQEIEHRRLAEEMLLGQAQELTAARDEAVSASRVKSEFLANMSHEIRTPLNGILGLTSILLQTRLNSDQQEYAKSVQRSGESLLTIIDDILDLSKLEERMLKVNPQPFNLRECVEDVAELMAAQLGDQDFSVNCYVPIRFPEWLIGDSHRIRQMLTNLMGNALKFTLHGEVNVEAVCLEEMERTATIRISVTDTGVGIDEANHQTVFNSFTQADGSLTRRHGGTGLGLTITKRLAELMGGTVGLKSTPGLGSTFWIDLPLEKQIPPTTLSERPRDLDRTSMLVLSENGTNREILQAYTSAWGCTAVTFARLPDAVAYLQQNESGRPFDYMVIDADVKETHHSLAMGEFRKWRLTAKTPAILMTSRPAHKRSRFDDGLSFVDTLPKPLRLAHLRNLLKRVIVGTKAEAQVSEASPQEEISLGLKVLMAEDNIVNAFVASKRLEEWQCTIEVAENGEEALNALEGQKFDVVLMDISMPVMDGLQATKELRRREMRTGQRTPVIAITAYALNGDRERCLDAGMDDYVAKPINFKELLEKLRYWGYRA